MEEVSQNFKDIIFQNLADGILVFDAKDSLILSNKKIESLFAVKESEIFGKSFLEIKNLFNLKSVSEELSYEKDGGLVKKELFFNEVKKIYYTATYIPLFSEKEKIGNLTILEDVTKAKEIEKRKDEFVSLAAHQLRTPSSAIKWSLEMMEEQGINSLWTQEQRDLFKKARESTERMITLIGDLLDIAKIEQGKAIFSSVPTDIEILLREVIASFQKQLKEKKIRLEFQKFTEGMPKIEIDKEKIKLAFQNLIDNAIRYTPPGGMVTVELKSDNIKKVEIIIKDTGIGIPKDQYHKVFSKFFRAKNAILMETEGSGLGLYITKSIIDTHKGEIWFTSEEGKGTTFYVTLPR